MASTDIKQKDSEKDKSDTELQSVDTYLDCVEYYKNALAGKLRKGRNKAEWEVSDLILFYKFYY